MAEGFEADLPRLGHFVRQRRLNLGLTQTQLGELLGWSQERVSLLENGKYGLPSLPHLTRLAQALSSPLNEVLHYGGVVAVDTTAEGDAPRSEQIETLSRQVVALVNQMGAVEGRVHDAERTLHEAERVQTKLRRQRQQMEQTLSRLNQPHQP